WTPFVPVTYSGGPAVGTSRYVQYRAVLNGSEAFTPTLMDVTVTIAPAGPDRTPPGISGVNAAPGSTTALVAWTTDENATSVVHYGFDPGQLSQTATVSGLTTEHAVTLTGLSEGTDYFF